MIKMEPSRLSLIALTTLECAAAMYSHGQLKVELVTKNVYFCMSCDISFRFTSVH
jgi:hypothetical protein